MTVVELSVEQLEDYIRCPNYFYIRHVNGILRETKQTVRAIAEKHKDRMFYTLMDGKIPDIDAVLSDFSSECIANKFPVVHRDVHQASNQLIILFNWLVENRVRVADIGSDFTLSFPKANAIVKGKFGVLRFMNDKLELLNAEFSNRNPDQTLVDISLRYTLQLYAVRKLIQKYEMAGIHVLTVRYNRVQELFSYRTETDFKRLENTVCNVAAAIRNNIFYPRETYDCTYCGVKAYCSGVLNYVNVGANHAD